MTATIECPRCTAEVAYDTDLYPPGELVLCGECSELIKVPEESE